MPFSEEERKCPRCGGYENWNFMVHVNGRFYCQKCYIDIFGGGSQNKAQEGNSDEEYPVSV